MFKDRNSFNCTGRLVADPDYRDFSNDLTSVRFRVAINQDYYKEEKVHEKRVFLSCKTAVKYSSSYKKFLKKGVRVAITGKLDQETYEKEGVKQSNIVVFFEADGLTILSDAKGSNSTESK